MSRAWLESSIQASMLHRTMTSGGSWARKFINTMGEFAEDRTHILGWNSFYTDIVRSLSRPHNGFWCRFLYLLPEALGRTLYGDGWKNNFRADLPEGALPGLMQFGGNDHFLLRRPRSCSQAATYQSLATRNNGTLCFSVARNRNKTPLPHIL